ncbi:CDP-glycerol glycerophosphotransferase family protein [Agromyces lapidis]|uniref:CDP-glycerol glycerophosphotransferase family protein n=1 Tax=Agromyces lapidis TaxID=279574 RepID=A0ABV5ST28_9MICO|nr:CDP-glycerol glycerophosphotransferase family protein [Agromyces lapidis]
MQPQFTIASAVYNVDRYLSDFFASLVSQSFGFRNLEVILVDDGSTDGSLDTCRAFAADHDNVRVLTQENQGQGAARNAGIAAASGEWITFVDPDDVLDEQYFQRVSAVMDRPDAADAVLFAGHTIMWDEATDARTDRHPNAFRFRNGSSVVDLEGKPNFVHGQAPLTFFRLDRIREHDVEFDDRLRTRFEDGKFVSEYLLTASRPVVGLVADAYYYYRQRADGSSSVQGARSDARTYEQVAKHGYLPLLGAAGDRFGRVPRWLQALIAYDLLWLFKVEGRDGAAGRSLPRDVLDAFLDDVAATMEYLEPESVLGSDIVGFPLDDRWALAHAFREGPTASGVIADAVDDDRDLVRLRYRYTGARPIERILSRGVEVTPHHATDRTLSYFGRVLAHERTAWVPAHGTTRIDLDGTQRTISTEETMWSPYKFRPAQERSLVEERDELTPPKFRVDFGIVTLVRRSLGRARRAIIRSMKKSSLSDTAVSLELRAPWNRKKYFDAWALIDREWDANDSAEEFYRWLRANRPEVNAWFMLSKDSPDWQRLRADGFRLVAYGSRQYRLLMIMAAELVSSHADAPIVNPFGRRYGRPRWRFTFLQHGVIKGDLSTWLNPKPIDTIVASTPAEYRYLSGEGPYRFSTREVRLTGMPRFDALLRKSAEVRPDTVRDILIAPTWRKYLAGSLEVRSQRHGHFSGFMDSEFARAWRSLLTDPTLLELARQHDRRLVFLPHPNLSHYLPEFDLPNEIEVLQYGGLDIQEVVARSCAMITDYSSIAFNLALLGRPSVYFQFDDERYWAEHTERRGYFDYSRDGFGPVTFEAASTIEHLRELLEGNDAKYVERTRAAFPHRDGRNSERVYEAIIAAGRAVPFQVASEPFVPEA